MRKRFLNIIGEIGERRLLPLGRSGRRATFLYKPCPLCLNPRWVAWRSGKPRNDICRSCVARKLPHPSGEKSSLWKGGRTKHRRGYILVRLEPDDFFYPMVQCTGYVLEHRLVVAKALGRCLHPWEIVHHKEGFAKDDNRYPETLQLVTNDEHTQITLLENRIKRLEHKVENQTQEIQLLKWHQKQRMMEVSGAS